MSNPMQSSRLHTIESAGDFTRSTAWGPSAAGAIGGFGATIWLATLGAALGLTATAAIVDDGMATSSDAVGLGAGAIGWLLVSAVIVGLVGGGLLAWTARDRRFRPVPWAIVTWAAGVTLAAIVGGLGTTGMMSAVGAATGTQAAQSVSSTDAGFEATRTSNAPERTLTAGETARAAEVAAAAAATVAWTAALAQLLALVVTVLSARTFHQRWMNAGDDVRAANMPVVPNPV